MTERRGEGEEAVIAAYREEGLSGRVTGLFRDLVLSRHRENPRPMPWRETADPYAILVSEVMLQQTRVERVLPKYAEFLNAFPDIATLAAAPVSEVLRLWQGLGYNRRGLALKRAAEEVAARFDGRLPCTARELATLPGIGPYTAGAVAAFACGTPEVFIETNIRSVFIHFFFCDREGIPDRDIAPLVEATLHREDARSWYYALMDYGVFLKKSLPNPSRRSRHHAVQSPFRGSEREIRGLILKTVLQNGTSTALRIAELTGKETERVERNAAKLVEEGFLVREDEAGYRLR